MELKTCPKSGTSQSSTSNLQAAMRWLGVPSSHPLRALLRLNKDLSLTVVDGSHIDVQLGAAMVADDLRPCLPKGVTLIQRGSSLVLVRDEEPQAAPPRLEPGVTANRGIDTLILPPPAGGAKQNSRPIHAGGGRRRGASVSTGTLGSSRIDKDIEAACKALSWSTGERQALKLAALKGLTVHLQTFQHAKEAGMLELRGLENLDYRELLQQLGFSPSSPSPWSATWRKRVSSADDEWQTARVTLGVNPVIQVSFQ